MSLGLALLGLASIPARSRADRVHPIRVLFVGNSYTRFNDLPRMVRHISESVPGAAPVWSSAITEPGYDLRRHWERQRARRRIEEGSFDAVVLQANSLSPLEAPDELRTYATRFAEHARAHGARVVLFETWARRDDHLWYRRENGVDDPEEMLTRIDTFYTDLAARLSAPLAPVGRAWARAHHDLPDTSLHRRDGTHPSVAGSYLSACVVYATLTGRDPRGATFRPHPLRREIAERIRELAAAAVAR